MKKVNKGFRPLIAIILTIWLGYWIGNNYDKPAVIESHSNIPVRPDSIKTMYFNFQNGKWKYLYSNDRTKTSNNFSRLKENEEEYKESFYSEEFIIEYIEYNIDVEDLMLE